MMLEHSSIYNVDKSGAQQERIYFVTFFSCARLFPTVRNADDILWCFVAARIVINKTCIITKEKPGEEKGKRERVPLNGSAAKKTYARIYVIEMITTTAESTVAAAKKLYNLTNGNLSQIWIMRRLASHRMT